MSNALLNETSPYLKQHAHNPVAWEPWSQAAWERAKRENKLVLVSIGYAACHWCHVMERESFEDQAIAGIMNRDFVCLKVDREERPDVDQVYIDAVSLLAGHAGWPLNCFCLPDGRPIYGGTYFQPAAWTRLLQRLQELWKQESDSLITQADQLTQALRRAEAGPAPTDALAAGAVLEKLREGVERAKLSFDKSEGGTQSAPKFPLPVNWRFFLRYGAAAQDRASLEQVRLTLRKMAEGGIHDQIGGGFARYSVDGIWKVPHFEKMLYDNGQLLGLYAQAHAVTGEAYWREVALGIAAFIQRDLASGDGLFHASLDADSEGVEGKFYVWQESELREILGDDFAWFAERHGVDKRGYWEEDNHILLRCGEAEDIAVRHGLTPETLAQKDGDAREKCRLRREERIHPGLDDKVLVSWNALAITGLAEAGAWLKDPALIDAACKAGEALKSQAMDENGRLHRSRQNGKFAIVGFLEDYAHLAWAFLQLHRVTQDPQWVEAAARLVSHAETHFTDPETGFYFFTSNEDEPLVARKMELHDNVLPSANGVMARCLYRLGILLERTPWKEKAHSMLARVVPQFATYLFGHGGWAELALDIAAPHYTVSILGPHALEGSRILTAYPVMQATVVAGVPGLKSLPCLQDLDAGGRDLFVVCRDGACLEPVLTAAEALAQMPPWPA